MLDRSPQNNHGNHKISDLIDFASPKKKSKAFPNLMISKKHGSTSPLMCNLYDEGNAKIRYLKLKRALDEKRQEIEKRENNFSQLSQYEQSLATAKQFYIEKYGCDLIEIYDKVSELESYMKVIFSLNFYSRIFFRQTLSKLLEQYSF